MLKTDWGREGGLGLDCQFSQYPTYPSSTGQVPTYPSHTMMHSPGSLAQPKRTNLHRKSASDTFAYATGSFLEVHNPNDLFSLPGLGLGGDTGNLLPDELLDLFEGDDLDDLLPPMESEDDARRHNCSSSDLHHMGQVQVGARVSR